MLVDSRHQLRDAHERFVARAVSGNFKKQYCSAHSLDEVVQLVNLSKRQNLKTLVNQDRR